MPSRDDNQLAARNDADDHEVGPRVRQEREYLGLKQEDVASVLGIPRAAVSAIENGKRKVSGGELKRLAALFGTTVDRLLGADVEEDATASALFRATKALTEQDRLQVLRFAEFLRESGAPPALNAGEQSEAVHP